MHPQILALELKLPLTKFVHSILTYYRIPPSQLSRVAWRFVLGFEALCALIVLDAYRHEAFIIAYALRKTAQDVCYFVPQSGCENIIVNMVDSDHSMRDTVVLVTDPSEAELEDERGAIPTMWNLGSVARGGAVLTAEIELKLQALTAVDYDCRNLSWLLDPNRTCAPSSPEGTDLGQESIRRVIERPRVLGRVVPVERKSASHNPRDLSFLKS